MVDIDRKNGSFILLPGSMSVKASMKGSRKASGQILMYLSLGCIQIDCELT